jgi:DNA-directed RNA polymerase subunit RPC12/RpoP
MSEKKIRKKMSVTEESFLNYLIDNDIKDIIPLIQPIGVIYSNVSGFEISEDERIEDLLISLTAKGFLTEQEYDRSIFCPNCSSIHVYSKLTCPRCNSNKVTRHELIEHPNCGFIGGVSELKKTNRGYICPNCGEILRNKKMDMATRKTDYLVIGSSYSCDNCGHKFDKPNTSHHCQNCGTIFDFRQAGYEKSYKYQLTNKIHEITPTRAIRDMIRSIEQSLLENDVQVELEGQLTGKSGEIRNFEIIAEKNKKKIVIDLSPWGKKEDLTNLLGKKMDIDVESTILIDMSGKNVLEPLGEVYQIKIFNGKNPDFNEQLSEYLNTLFREKQESKGFFSQLWKSEEKKIT